MTIIKRGLRACPQCGSEHVSYNNISSSSFAGARGETSGKPLWSDGFGSQSYFAIKDDLSRCWKCEMVFRECEASWRETDDEPEMPRLFGKNSSGGADDFTLPDTFEQLLTLLDDQLFGMDGSLLDADPQQVLHAGAFTPSAEYLLRLKWWWRTNHAYRKEACLAQQAIELGGKDSPDLPDSMLHNLNALIPLLHPDRHAPLLGEICRHLGRFQAAHQYFEKRAQKSWPMGPTIPTVWLNQLAELARLNRTDIVMLALPEA